MGWCYPKRFSVLSFGVGVERLITLNPVAGNAYAIKNNRMLCRAFAISPFATIKTKSI
jgi:hypothetical protein